jgi:hypothetical protein
MMECFLKIGASVTFVNNHERAGTLPNDPDGGIIG